MTTYDGPATVIADGAEHEVAAHLAISTDGRLKEWHGTLDTQDDGAAWQIQEARSATLRTTDGREGTFFPVRLEVGSTELEIQGSGHAPFGD
ncbi:DUF4873 domain-containing protein [Streptomyces turgidiscabies]|uniref:DUF4873 domain-containing protein n=1 Tax=Streptomyces turgidiscabies TaxID=85558 RepID=UPI0038F68969